MPYTLSHAAISLPVSLLARGKIPLAALVVGSMSPDFPYLLALTTTDAPGHSVIGVLIYCLVPSLVVLFVWYRWLESPTLDLLRLPQRTWSFGILSYFMVVAGVLVGAYSHVLWDATSHAHGALVVNSEFWQKEVFSLPLYKWNQYGSGILGLIALFIWYLRAMSENCRDLYKGKLAVSLVIHTISVVLFVVLANVIHGSYTLSEFAVRSAVGVITGGAVGTCIYALVVNLRVRENIA